jgi:DNA-binding NtrC family response regulator
MDRSILVVDDDPYLLEVITLALSDAGYQVRRATNGKNALREIERDEPDLVLSDIRMPQLTGIELAEHMQRRRASVPIVLMSAAHNIPDGPAVPVLAKPFSLDDLLSLVEGLLDKHAREPRVRPANGHVQNRATPIQMAAVGAGMAHPSRW